MSRTLQTMAHMRRMVVEEARRDLIACLQAESAAQDRERATIASLAQERAVVSAPHSDDASVEAYVAWLPAGLRHREAAREAAQRATAASAQARAPRNAGRAAEEAVTRRLTQEAEQARALILKREQDALDEAGQARRGG